MSESIPCTKCSSPYPYADRGLMVCPECGHEWNPDEPEPSAETGLVVRDSNGVQLADGDTVVLIKDLKVKGGGGSIKVGTKVKNIRLVEGDHDIDCKVPGFGAMRLKSEFVKKG